MKTCAEVRIGERECFGPSLTLSKAVEHARGCVATKIGLVDIFVRSRPSAQTMLQVTAGGLANRREVVNNSSDHSFLSDLERLKSQTNPGDASQAVDEGLYVAK